MLKQFILIITLLGISFSRVPIEEPRLQEYKEDALEIIENVFYHNINNLGSRLQAIYQNTFIKDAFSNQETGLSELQCEKIMKKFDYEESSLQDKYLLVQIVNTYCKDFTNSPKIIQFQQDFQQALRKDSLEDIYYGFMALESFKSEQFLSNLIDICDKLNSYVLQDGTGKPQKRSENNSYYYSALVFELYEKCIPLRDTQAHVKKMGSQLKVPIGSTLLNAFELSQSQLAILEKDRNSVETTARIVRAIKSIFTYNLEPLQVVENQFKEIYQIPLLRFLKDKEDNILTYYQKYHIIRLYKQFNDTVIPFVRQLPALGSKTYTEVQFRWETLMGSVVPLEQTQELNTNLNVVLLDRQYNTVQDNLQVLQNEKNQEWNSKVQFDTAKINELGFYNLKFTNNKVNNSNPFQFTERVYLVTKVKCDDLQFEVTQSQHQPSEYSNRLKEYEKILMPVKLSGDKDWVHFKFRLDFDRQRHILPKFVGISLLHPNHGQTSSVQQAKYNEETNYFHVKLNLSDSNVLLPYSNTYEVQLMVSDQKLRENIAWKFAKFQIKYLKPRQEKPPSDLDFVQLPEITHTFKEPHVQPPGFLVGFFCILILAIFFMYVINFSAVDANFSSFPANSMAKLSNTVFVIYTAFMLGLLVYYWIALNLYEIVLILLVVTIPYLLTGRYALSYLQFK